MRFNRVRFVALAFVSMILIAAVSLPIRAANAQIQNISVSKLVDDQFHKETLYVITTDESTYHIIARANITVIGSEVYINLSATLYNPHNATIIASAQIPDTLADAPYYSGSVEAFRMHLDVLAVIALKVALPIVVIVALVLQIIDIIEDYVEHAILETLKTLIFGGPFIYASLPWVFLTLLQDTNPDGSFDMYVPYWPALPHLNLILQRRYYVATGASAQNLSWWKISEEEVYTDIPIPFDGVWHIVWFTYFVATYVGTVNQPPSASFYWRPIQPIVGEEVAFISTSFDPDGSIVSQQWWLGDGNQKTDRNFTYVYQDSGVYNVTLKVVDDDGKDSNVTHSISVLPAVTSRLRVVPDHMEIHVPRGQYTTSELLVGESLNQSDLLGVSFQVSDLMNTADNSTISSGNVMFDKNGITIPKGSYTNVTVTIHAPADSSIGWYYGNITASSQNGDNATVYVDVFVFGPPVASFTYTPSLPSVNEIVTFNASASLPGYNGTYPVPISEYRWDFSDGNKTATTTDVICHSFDSQGVYFVVLTVFCSGAIPETGSTTEKVMVVSGVPVGGYSVSIQKQGKQDPQTLQLAIVLLLATGFAITRRKSRKTHKTLHSHSPSL